MKKILTILIASLLWCNIGYSKEIVNLVCSWEKSIENRPMGYTGGKKKFGYDLDENNYYVPCEKEQSLIRQMQTMRSAGESYKTISENLTKSTRKKFPISWVHKIVQRELQGVA